MQVWLLVIHSSGMHGFNPLNSFYHTHLNGTRADTCCSHDLAMSSAPRFISFQDHNSSCLFLRELFNNSTFLAAQQLLVFQHKPKSVLSALHYLPPLHLPMPASYLSKPLQRCSSSLQPHQQVVIEHISVVSWIAIVVHITHVVNTAWAVFICTTDRLSGDSSSSIASHQQTLKMQADIISYQSSVDR